MKSQKKYKAFTLLELIVSLVVLGIVMAAFPAFFQTSLDANKQLQKEEVFFEEFSMLSIITSRYYDQNNSVGNNFYKDVNATHGDSDLYNDYSSDYAGKTSRLGKTEIDNNIFRSGTSASASPIGLDAGEDLNDTTTLNDIDDFNGYSENFLGYNITVNVKYINDEADYKDDSFDFNYDYTSNADYTNLKLITINCNVDGSNVVLRYVKANIGASKFLSLEEISR